MRAPRSQAAASLWSRAGRARRPDRGASVPSWRGCNGGAVLVAVPRMRSGAPSSRTCRPSSWSSSSSCSPRMASKPSDLPREAQESTLAAAIQVAGEPDMQFGTYARFSSDAQHPASIDDQRLACQRYVGQHGGVIASEQQYADEALSGIGVEHRPGYRRLLAAIASAVRPFDALLVDDL